MKSFRTGLMVIIVFLAFHPFRRVTAAPVPTWTKIEETVLTPILRNIWRNEYPDNVDEKNAQKMQKVNGIANTRNRFRRDYSTPVLEDDNNYDPSAVYHTVPEKPVEDELLPFTTPTEGSLLPTSELELPTTNRDAGGQLPTEKLELESDEKISKMSGIQTPQQKFILETALPPPDSQNPIPTREIFPSLELKNASMDESASGSSTESIRSNSSSPAASNQGESQITEKPTKPSASQSETNSPILSGGTAGDIKSELESGATIPKVSQVLPPK